MNLKQAARKLGVHYQTAYRWVRAGRLAAVRVGNGYEISERAIEQLIAETAAMRSIPADEEPEAAPIDAPALSAECLIANALAAYDAMSMSPRAVFEVVSDGLARCLGDLAVVRVLGDDDDLVVRSLHHKDARRLGIAWTGFEMHTRQMHEHHERVAISTRKPVLIRHLPQDQLRANTAPEMVQFFDEARPHSLICVPACHGADVRAVITVSREFPSRPFTPDDVVLVNRLATVVGAAVVRANDAQEAWRRRRALMFTLSEIGDLVEGVECMEHLVSDGNAAELICSVDGRIMCANTAAGNLGSIAPEKLIGLSVTELPIPHEQPSERDLLARLAVGELTFADASRAVIADDGTRHHLAVHRGVVRSDAAEPVALVVVANQIPEPEPCSISFAAAS